MAPLPTKPWQSSSAKAGGRSARLPLAIAAVSMLFWVAGCKSKPAPVPQSAAPQGATLPPAPAKPPATPYTSKHIYSETADPHADIALALKQARREHKRVLLDFGGDWCGDCQVLDIYFHQPPNADLIDRYFLIVHVWIGHMDQHLDVPERYGVPIHKGVPALAVLNANGKVLYAQKTGEFEDMRHMDSRSVTDFLNRWKS